MLASALLLLLAQAPPVPECGVTMSCVTGDLPDGGLRPRYLRLRTNALLCHRLTSDGGEELRLERDGLVLRWPRDALVLRWPRAAGRPCFEPIGRGLEFVEADGGCSEPSLCNEDSSGVQGKPCFEAAGEERTSWPPECPQ